MQAQCIKIYVSEALTHDNFTKTLAKLIAFVAQMDRALPSGGKGRGFESRRMRHKRENDTV